MNRMIGFKIQNEHILKDLYFKFLGYGSSDYQRAYIDSLLNRKIKS